jgi:hypothetical protein
MEINKSKGVEAKNRAHKLKSGVNRQRDLKQKRVKQFKKKVKQSRYGPGVAQRVPGS